MEEGGIPIDNIMDDNDIPKQLLKIEPSSDKRREIYFYFFVNRGSGGQKSSLLLDLGIEELKLNNFISEESFPNLESIFVKISPLNDLDIKKKRMDEVSALSLSKKGRL